jgi:hypothetical protein
MEEDRHEEDYLEEDKIRNDDSNMDDNVPIEPNSEDYVDNETPVEVPPDVQDEMLESDEDLLVEEEMDEPTVIE